MYIIYVSVVNQGLVIPICLYPYQKLIKIVYKCYLHLHFSSLRLVVCVCPAESRIRNKHAPEVTLKATRRKSGKRNEKGKKKANLDNPPVNKHIPPMKKENHRAPATFEGDMFLPRRVIIIFVHFSSAFWRFFAGTCPQSATIHHRFSLRPAVLPPPNTVLKKRRKACAAFGIMDISTHPPQKKVDEKSFQCINTWIFLLCIKFVPKITRKIYKNRRNFAYLEDPGIFIGFFVLPEHCFTIFREGGSCCNSLSKTMIRLFFGLSGLFPAGINISSYPSG